MATKKSARTLWYANVCDNVEERKALKPKMDGYYHLKAMDGCGPGCAQCILSG